MVTDFPNVHTAVSHAGPAVGAPALVHLDADDIEPVEQSVDRAERTEKTAERTVQEHTGCSDDQHDDKLPRKQDSKHAKLRGIDRIRQKPDRPFKCPGRTDVLAESRHRNAELQAIPQRDRHSENSKNHIFEPGKSPCDAGLADLRRRDLVKELLNQSQRTEPAADRPPEHDAKQKDHAEHIPPCTMAGGIERVLNRTQRARTHCAGAGIAVEARDTQILCLSLIDLSLDKALQVRIIQKRAVELSQTTRGGAVRLPPRSFCLIIQGQYTPYKY